MTAYWCCNCCWSDWVTALSHKSFSRCCHLTEEREAHTWSRVSNMMMTAKCKKIKRINHKVKNVQHKCLHHSDCLLLLNHKQQQIMNLCRLAMITVMLSNTNNVDDDMLNEWHLHTIKVMLKLRLMNIIDCHSDNMISKYMQVVNSAVKEHRDLLSLMHYKMTRNFLSNWITQLSEHLAIVTILILNNVALTDVVADMFWTAETTERI